MKFKLFSKFNLSSLLRPRNTFVSVSESLVNQLSSKKKISSLPALPPEDALDEIRSPRRVDGGVLPPHLLP